MASVIGELFVNLRAGTSEYTRDIRNAVGTSRGGAEDMSRAFRQQTESARRSLEVLPEIIGVHIPRAMRTVIAESEILGPALSAAFSGIVIIAAVELVYKFLKGVADAASVVGGMTEEMKKFQKATEDANKAVIDERVKASYSFAQQMLAQQSEAINKATQQLERQGRTDPWAAVKVETADILDHLFRSESASDHILRLTREHTALLDEVNKRNKDALLSLVKQTYELQQQNKAIGLSAVAQERLTLSNAQFELQLLQSIQMMDAITHKNTLDMAPGMLDQRIKLLQAQVEGGQKQLAATLATEAADASNKQAELFKSFEDKYRAALGSAMKMTGDFDKTLQAEESAAIAGITDTTRAYEQFMEQHPAIAKRSQMQIVEVHREAEAAIAAILAAGAKKADAHYDEEGKKILETLEKIRAESGALFNLPLGPPVQLRQARPLFDPEQIRLAELQRKGVQELENDIVGMYERIRTPQQKYMDEVREINALVAAGIGFTQQQADQLIHKLSPAYLEAMRAGQEMARSLADGLEQIVVSGGKVRDVLAQVLEQIARIILQMALNPLEKMAGNLFGSILGGLFGGGGGVTAAFNPAIFHPTGFQHGGDVLPGHPILVGEGGVERWTPMTPGHISPSGAGGDTYYLDLRGADAGVEARFQRMIRQGEIRSVAAAVATVRENRRRGRD